MSFHGAPSQSPISALDLIKRKQSGQKFSVVTCYDSAFARLIEMSSVDMVLVGDSMGNVVLGHNSTIPVTMDDMVHHTAAVARVMKRAFLCADMPFFSYHISKQQALENAALLVQKGGAQAVKLEGGIEVCEQVKAITQAGIPVVAHLGLTPQSVHALGGYKVQGRSDAARKLMLDNAKALEEAGATALVLEMVPASLAGELTATLKIPTIGIGAGPQCDAQVLVLHDLLGFDQSFKPKFLKRYANLQQIVGDALSEYDRDVKSGTFPSTEHSFSD